MTPRPASEFRTPRRSRDLLGAKFICGIMTLRVFLMTFMTVVSGFSGMGLRPNRLHNPSVAMVEADEDSCGVDEIPVECEVRKKLDGPWSDVWARYVLLRPGMTYGELKEATKQRNRLDPRMRIPGTARTVVLTHAVCFLIAVPAILRSTHRALADDVRQRRDYSLH